ncbi:aminotransferase, partial [Streptomyces sp. NPDC002553]
MTDTGTRIRPRTAPRPLLLPDGRPAALAWSLDPGMLHLNHGSFGAVPRAAHLVPASARILAMAVPQDPAENTAARVERCWVTA